MYSKIPMPQVEWTKESMQYCICFFPAVGAVIGAATLLWNMLVGAKLSGSLLFTAVLILIPVLITGGIHLDFGIYSEADAHTIGLLAIGFVISRTLSGLSLVSFRMAKNTGLAATFSDMALKSRVRIVMICYLIVCAGLLLYLDPLYGTAELIGALLVFFWYRHLSYEKFGGITGDLAGFFLQNCELFMAVCVIGLRIVLR